MPGGVIKLGLSEYVFCDHFGFVYAFALEECDRVVADQLPLKRSGQRPLEHLHRCPLQFLLHLQIE